MSVKNNPPIAHVNCRSCGVRCTVHQQQSKNAFFYTRFCSCKPGKEGQTTRQNELKPDAEQQYILDNMVLIEGAEYRDPPHVAKMQSVISSESAEWSPVDEMEPEVIPKTEPGTEPKTEPEKKPVKVGFIVSMIALITAGVGLVYKGVSNDGT